MCVANAARSQLAEGVAKQLLGDRAEIHSAGSRPASVHPMTTVVLGEMGVDCSLLYSKGTDDLPQDFVDQLDYVITLCAEEVCPAVISKAKKLHWPLPDPANPSYGDDEQLTAFRWTREEIRRRLESFQSELNRSE